MTNSPSAPSGVPAPTRTFELRFRNRRIPLLQRSIVVGRSPDCDVLLDSSLVSRQHARLTIVETNGELRLEIFDLGSRNGVSVNGVRIDGNAMAQRGDRLSIGGEEATLELVPLPESGRLRRAMTLQNLELEARSPQSGIAPSEVVAEQPAKSAPMFLASPAFEAEDAAAEPPTELRRATGMRRVAEAGPTATAEQSPSVPPLTDGSHASPSDAPNPFDDVRGESETRAATTLGILQPVFEKALRLNRPEEAERYVERPILLLVESLRAGRAVNVELSALAAGFAVRLAEAGGRGRWATIAVELYYLQNRLMAPELVDLLYVVLRRAPGFDVKLLRDYVEQQQRGSEHFSPGERFVLKRLAGLVQIAALTA